MYVCIIQCFPYIDICGKVVHIFTCGIKTDQITTGQKAV